MGTIDVLVKAGPPKPVSELEAAIFIGIILGGVLQAVLIALIRSRHALFR